MFVLEGAKMVREAIEAHADKVVAVYGLQEFSQWVPPPIPFTEITEKELVAISAHPQPHQALAIVKKEEFQLPKKGWIIALEKVQDPGNLGTIIRLADWFAASAVLCSLDTVDCYNEKVVQATMGSILRVPIVYVESLAAELKKDPRTKYAADLSGENLYQSHFPDEGILVMGNESQGISEEILAVCQHAIHIPKWGKAESLNVAMATGILLSHIRKS